MSDDERGFLDERADFNDSAIGGPEDDLYGVNPFALALADRIANLKGTVGSTIALNGPWGSGKSSIVNLIRHHLKPYEENNELLVFDFGCWWFRGEEALTMMFLQELESACRKTLGDRAKRIFKKARKRFVVGEAIGDWIKAAADDGWQKATAQFAARYFTGAQTLEEIFERLGELLKEQDKRIIVIIDDIDRLTPREQLQIFRLVKSVGRLPRILYLLVFDREIAESEISAAFSSEGPHFLEKIIQANFDIPPPERDVLNDVLYKRIYQICGDHSEVDEQYFFNSFHSITPYITVPRHVIRLANAMAITFPPVKGQVNVADYIAIETLRLFEPKLYGLIRRSKGRLCGTSRSGDEDDERIKPFLDAVEPERREIASEILKRLFPRLQNVGYGSDFHAEWEANRQICARQYFDTYFRLQVGEHILSREDLDRFIANAGDVEMVTRTLLEAAQTRRKDGRSTAAVWLEELNSHAKKIARENTSSVLEGLFQTADTLWLADKRNFRREDFDNRLRIYWLTWKLVGDRFTLAERSKIVLAALNNASLAWLAYLALDAWEDYHPKRGPAQPPEKCLVEEGEIAGLRHRALTAIRAAAERGELIHHGKLGYLVYRWKEFAEDGGEEVKTWLAAQLRNAEGVVAMASMFTSESFSQGVSMFDDLPDHVGKLTTSIDLAAIKDLVDPHEFRYRLSEIYARAASDEDERKLIKAALDAWNRQDAGVDDF